MVGSEEDSDKKGRIRRLLRPLDSGDEGFGEGHDEFHGGKGDDMNKGLHSGNRGHQGGSKSSKQFSRKKIKKEGETGVLGALINSIKESDTHHSDSSDECVYGSFRGENTEKATKRRKKRSSDSISVSELLSSLGKIKKRDKQDSRPMGSKKGSILDSFDISYSDSENKDDKCFDAALGLGPLSDERGGGLASLGGSSSEDEYLNLTVTPTHKMAAPMWTQDGHHKIASRGGQLGGTSPAREVSWGHSSLQGSS